MIYRRKEVFGGLRLRMFVRRHCNPLVAIIVVVTMISILSWGAKARWASIDGTSTASTVQRDKVPIPTNIQVETFTLGFDGFEPKQIDRRPGPFVLGINNYTRSRASFELVREDGNRVHEIKWPSGQTRYRKLMNLPAGDYRLRDVNHPDWTARIIIGK